MLVNRVPNVLRSLQPGEYMSPPSQAQIRLGFNPSPQAPRPYSPQRGVVPSSLEPASVAYAKARNSVLSNNDAPTGPPGSQASSQTVHGLQNPTSAQPTHGSQYPQPLSRSQPPGQQAIREIAAPSPTNLQITNEAEENEEDGSLLAYARNSTVSSEEPESPRSSYPPTLKPVSAAAKASTKTRVPPPLPEPRVHQHEDGGPVLEVPPAYRDRYTKYLPRPAPR